MDRIGDYKILCVRIIEFDAGHRLFEHPGKCAKLHGHRYKGEFYFGSKALDSLGMVVDFGLLYSKIGGWIDDNLDHNMILNKKDVEFGRSVEKCFGQKVYYMDCNPTAENIARHLLVDVCPKLIDIDGLTCVKVKLWETPNCFVEAFL